LGTSSVLAIWELLRVISVLIIREMLRTVSLFVIGELLRTISVLIIREMSSHFPHDKDRDGPQYDGLLAIQPPDMAANPGKFC